MLSIETAPDERPALIKAAFVLEWITIAWMSVEAAVAIGAGLIAHSITLMAFGVDSVIELASAGVLIWRLRVELERGQAFSEKAEERASKIAGALLFAVAAYVIASAAWSLWTRSGETFSAPGLIVALIAIPAMWWLSRAKLKIADKLGSRALRADAVEAITCGYLSIVWSSGSVRISCFTLGGSTASRRSRSCTFSSRKGAKRGRGRIAAMFDA